MAFHMLGKKQNRLSIFGEERQSRTKLGLDEEVALILLFVMFFLCFFFVVVFLSKKGPDDNKSFSLLHINGGYVSVSPIFLLAFLKV